MIDDCIQYLKSKIHDNDDDKLNKIIYVIFFTMSLL